MIFTLAVFFAMASSLRLITLPPLDRKGAGIFIRNDNMRLRLERASPSSILDMYVVVHSRKIYFYSKGNYYGFGYDSDNITLKLVPVTVGKIQYFSQEAADRPKVMRWRGLLKRARDDSSPSVKTIRTVQSVSEKETLEEDSTARVPHVAYLLKSKMPGDGYGLREGTKYERAPGIDEPRPGADYGAVFKNLGEILQTYKRPVQRNAEKEIESDSEMLDGRSLDIGIEVVDQREKTFVLRNDRNLCVTYFQKSFIMTACIKNKRQIFKLVGAEGVADKFRRPAKKRGTSAFDETTVKEESSSSDERPTGTFYELATKKINEELQERLGDDFKLGKEKRGKDRKKEEKKSGGKNRKKEEKKVKGRAKGNIGKRHNGDSDRSSAPSSMPMAPQESSAENNEIKKSEQPEPSSAAGPPPFKPSPPQRMPKRIDEYCRDMYSRSMGQANRLPQECLAFFGFKVPGAPPTFRRTVRFPISVPQGARISAVAKLPKNFIPKVAEKSGPKSEPVAAKTVEQQNINVIERLERALGTDTFFK